MAAANTSLSLTLSIVIGRKKERKQSPPRRTQSDTPRRASLTVAPAWTSPFFIFTTQSDKRLAGVSQGVSIEPILFPAYIHVRVRRLITRLRKAV